MEVDRNGPEVLDGEECLRLLGKAVIGRMALSRGALPVIVPVDLCSTASASWCGPATGTKLDHALAGSVVAFEVDDIDRWRHRGWSVAVTGVATGGRRIPEPARCADLSGA